MTIRHMIEITCDGDGCGCKGRIAADDLLPSPQWVHVPGEGERDYCPTCASKHKAQLPLTAKGRRIAVVFVSYLKVPEERLQDHFRWNKAAYESHGDRLRVYVVSDVEHDLPSYARVCVFPIDQLPLIRGQRKFSLTKTKNFGNDAAIADGADVVICTDVDIAFEPNQIGIIADVTDKIANIPVYRLAPSYEKRVTGNLDHGCTGTVAMTAANWQRIRFDERCVGYGADDGILLRDIQAAGLTVDRHVIVSHIAHVQGDLGRNPGSGASTCWGRSDGFNFDNFRENRKLHRLRGDK